MDFLNEYTMPVVLGICLCTGYIMKQWIKDIENKYIPTLCALLGIVCAAWLSEGSITPQVILSGLVSGLASTGMHQIFKQYIENERE